MRILQQAFEIIHLVTGENPLQVFAKAVQNVCPTQSIHATTDVSTPVNINSVLV